LPTKQQQALVEYSRWWQVFFQFFLQIKFKIIFNKRLDLKQSYHKQNINSRDKMASIPGVHIAERFSAKSVRKPV